jgi:hypothetical protein
MLSVACYNERNQGLLAAAQGRKGVKARSTFIMFSRIFGHE